MFDFAQFGYYGPVVILYLFGVCYFGNTFYVDWYLKTTNIL